MSALVPLIRKDFAALWRDKGVLLAAPCFAITCVVICSFAFRRIGYGEAELRALTPGVLVLVFLFSSVSVLTHSFLCEWKANAFEGLLLSPINPAMIFLSKFLVNLLLLACVLAVVTTAHAIFFGAQIMALVPSLFLCLLLGAVGFVSLGTLLASVSAASGAREFLLSVILFPLSIPFVYAVVSVLRELLDVGAVATGGFWFMFLCVISALAFVLSTLLFEFIARP